MITKSYQVRGFAFFFLALSAAGQAKEAMSTLWPYVIPAEVRGACSEHSKSLSWLFRGCVPP